VRPEIRSILLPFQQLFAGQKGGAVLVGRDTGTVICPEAFMKFFIVASVEARAERRFKELQERGVETMYEQVLAELVERDRRDSDRDVAPLRAAPDAVLLDTTDMDIETALVQAGAIVEARVRDEWHDKPNVWR
jgi:cytidylate kinase